MRWQDANKPPGFYGLKDSVRMRSSTDPNFKINWDPFVSVNRHTKQVESVQGVSPRHLNPTHSVQRVSPRHVNPT